MTTADMMIADGGDACERILIADDEEIIREMLHGYLTDEGFEVDMAVDGLDAIAKIRNVEYGIIITDIRLPGANGMEVLRAAKTSSPQSEVVVMTAYSTEDLAIEAVRLGAYDYLKKPVEDVGLFALLVRQILQKQSLSRLNHRLLENLQSKNDELNSANTKLMAMATTDPLTGIYNRRYILARLDQQFQQTVRYGDPFALLIMDLDHFKHVNDTYGHQIGDEVLKHFVRSTRGLIRTTDLFGRYGGEEFLLLLLHSEVHDACATAERLRSEVCASPLVHGDLEVLITVSIGVATAPGSDVDDPLSMVRAADAALYRAKSEGRNRVVLSQATTAEAHSVS